MKPLLFTAIFAITAIGGGQSIGTLTALSSIGPAIACALTAAGLLAISFYLLIWIMTGRRPSFHVAGASRGRSTKQRPAPSPHPITWVTSTGPSRSAGALKNTVFVTLPVTEADRSKPTSSTDH